MFDYGVSAQGKLPQAIFSFNRIPQDASLLVYIRISHGLEKFDFPSDEGLRQNDDIKFTRWQVTLVSMHLIFPQTDWAAQWQVSFDTCVSEAL